MRLDRVGLPAGPLGPSWASVGKGFSPFVLLQNHFFENKNRKREVFHILNN
jgi:hypothetical protein